MGSDHIEFTADKFKEFKRIYKKAIKEEKESFTFEGKEVLVAYAKYMIEYLEPKFK